SRRALRLRSVDVDAGRRGDAGRARSEDPGSRRPSDRHRGAHRFDRCGSVQSGAERAARDNRERLARRATDRTRGSGHEGIRRVAPGGAEHQARRLRRSRPPAAQSPRRSRHRHLFLKVGTRVRYELFIGLRYLRAKRREAFISLITIISTLGIAIGVMTLDITLSVMTGFEEDLRDRILGFNPHVSIWSYLGPLQDHEDVAAKTRAVAGVSSAEPFVYGQLMLTTPEHFASVLVRGIRPSSAANPDLAGRLRSGSIDQLERRFAVPLQEGRGATVELPGIIVGRELARAPGAHVRGP